MLYGTVEYGFKEGGVDGKDWAARVLLVNNGSDNEVGGASGLGGWKMKLYQVYLVSWRSSCCVMDWSRTR